ISLSTSGSPPQCASAVGGSGADAFYGNPAHLALSVDGQTLYAASPTARTVTPVATATDTPGTPIDFSALDSGDFEPTGIAVTPDGKQLVVSDGYGPSGCAYTSCGDDVQIVSLPGDTLSGSPIDLHTSSPGTIDDVQITPDQAPVADFTVAGAPPGQATSFDASTSTVAYGTIASYRWDFGDGSPPVTTTTPTTTHVYAGAGDYSASVTETSSGGTSTPDTTLATGRGLLRHGSASAQATRSVIIGTGPQPAVSLSASSVDFGAVGVGKASAPQTITVTNSGQAPLTISTAALGGADPGDYRIAADGCAGHTIVAGASCATQLTFAPTGGGQRTAQLAFTDNASGSPHTVFLSGSGATTGTLTGVVVNASTAPTAGVQVQICPRSQTGIALGGAGCRYATTEMTGRYGFSGLTPGSWAMQVTPPTGLLFGSAAIVQIRAGAQTQDFTLHAPVALHGGASFDTPSGTVTNGV
ncbi:MAG: choice-of-anchor D domain-containing protein, partial [Solirubrobacteraceae bacterium]